MAVNYHEPLSGIAIRAGQIAGVALATLETNYATRPLTATQFKGATFTFRACKDALQYAEERLARAIAKSREAQERAYLAGVTASLANEAALPSVDSLSRPIIGVWGGVYDASDGTQLTDEKGLAFVRERAANPGSFFRVSSYQYALDGGRIYHTRTNVVIRVCVYDRGAQRTALDANSAMLLPDDTEEALVCGGVSYLFRDDAFNEQAKLYRRYFDGRVRDFDPHFKEEAA